MINYGVHLEEARSQKKNLGILDLQTNLKISNYDTNKFSSFLINDFDWNSKELNLNNGLNGTFLGKIKNVSVKAKPKCIALAGKPLNIPKLNQKGKGEAYQS